jgi:hypothetical protein
MADNIQVTPGSGAAVATDLVTIDGAAAHVQRTKVTHGVAGAAVDASSSNPLPVALFPSATTIGDGRKVVTTAGTSVALATSTSCREVTITALSTNSGTILVGGSTVVAAAGTRRGVPLAAGASITLSIDNLSSIYIDATASSEGVSYLYLA